MRIVCPDLEGVLIPEVWINVAERTAIPRAATDDARHPRLRRVDEAPARHPRSARPRPAQDPGGDRRYGSVPGAGEFLDQLRERYQVLILSDTFYEFAAPFMRKLGWPTLVLSLARGRTERPHRGLSTAPEKSQARGGARAARPNFHTVAAGDSYNDTTHARGGRRGDLVPCAENVIRDFPQFPQVETYAALSAEISQLLPESDKVTGRGLSAHNRTMCAGQNFTPVAKGAIGRSSAPDGRIWHAEIPESLGGTWLAHPAS